MAMRNVAHSHVLQPALAGKRDRRVLDRQIAQIERLAERQKANDQ